MSARSRLSRSCLPLAAAGCVLAAAGANALAQPADSTALIYTCTDAQGRPLTQDRPILACLDREQRVLNSSGVVVRVIEPGLTAAEREAREVRARQAIIDRQRERDIIRRDQALITRYPDEATHQAARKEALVQTQLITDTVQGMLDDLAKERQGLDQEMEFYSKDPSKAPFQLRRAIEDNIQAVQVNRRTLAAQTEERNRINARFDQEAQRLRTLWQTKNAPEPASSR